MLYSLLIKMAMLGLTMGVVVWIGWTIPQFRHIDPERASEFGTQQAHPLRSTGPLAVSEAAFNPHMAQSQDLSPTPKRSVAEKLDLNWPRNRILKHYRALVRYLPSGSLNIGKLVAPFGTWSNCVA